MLQNRLTELAGFFADGEDVGSSDRIIRAASELFMSNGYEGTSTDAIAAAAGVQPSELYRLFSSKDGILFASLETIFQAFLADMESAVEGVSDPTRRLARLVWAHTWVQLSFEIFSREGLGMMFSTGQLLSSISDGHGGRVRELARQHVQNVRLTIEEGVREGSFSVPDLRSSSQAILTIAEYSPLWFRVDGPLSPNDVADHNAVYALRLVGADAQSLGLEDLHAMLADPEAVGCE